MSNLRLETMRSYAEADTFLGRRSTKRVGHNTYARRMLVPNESDVPEHAIAVCYHDTDIVTYYDDGSIVLDTGGWDTATTVNRMNMLTPAHVRLNHRFKKKPYRVDWTLVTVDNVVETLHRRITIRPLTPA